MKNCLLFLFLIVSSYVPLKAQMNLVPNPSFENVISCPNGTAQFYLANPWENFNNSPDIFCQCSPIGVSVPINNFGYQFAKDGQCMAGIVTFRRQNSPNGPNAREFIGIQLVQPLVVGNEYFFSGYVNCADGPSVIVGSNNLGMKLLTYSIDSSTGPLLITNSATIFMDSVMIDTINWFKISGSFIADSAYSYLVIGNFFDDLNTDTLSFVPGTPDYTYYYVDGICLSSDSAYCENWTSYQELSGNDSKLIIFPNPVLSTLNITSELGIKSIAVKNVFGRQLLYFERITESSTIINLEELPSGIYIVEIDLGESISNRKIIKL